MIKSVKITLPKKSSNSKSKTKKSFNPNKKLLLNGHLEVKENCLKYFCGCWIKMINKTSYEYNSGGFLTKIDSVNVYLRTIQKSELIEFPIKDNVFFVKEDSEQYFSMQQIELEKERNKIESSNMKEQLKILKEKQRIFETKKKIFEKERIKFERIRNKFLKLVQDGKAKILI